MQKKFLTNLFLLLILNLLIKPFYIFGIDMEVQDIAEGYGIYFALFNTAFLFNILLDFGVTNFNNRNIAQHSQLLNKHFSSIVLLKIFLAVLYSLITFSIGFILDYDAEQFKMLGWLCFNQFLLSFILYLRSNISGLLMFKTDSLLSVLDRVLMIIIIGSLLWGGFTDKPFQIEWFVYGQTAGYAITALIALIIVIKKAAFKKLNWNVPFFIMIIKQSLPFAILVLLMSFYNRIDPILLLHLLGDEVGEVQNAIYAHSYRLLDAGCNFSYLFSILLLPLFARMIKLKQNIEELVKMAFTFLFIGSVTVALMVSFYSYELMDLMYDKYIAESAQVNALLIFSFIPISMIYIFGTLLTANGNLKQLNYIALFSMIINISFNIILIPELLAKGSVYASLGAQYFSALVQFYIAFRIFKFRINITYITKLFVFIALIITIGSVSKSITNNWLINMSIIALASFIISSLLKLFDFKNLIRIIRSQDI
ncbi:MAG: oligosaccharide flippase family protein [Bacteroidales bacterium]|nr:oligosaccharide flippase family protein [Bacteroidales bacterium]